MGSSVCKCDSGKISNLFEFFTKLSDQQLDDNVTAKLTSVRTKPLTFTVPNSCQNTFCFLKKSDHDNIFINSEKQRITIYKQALISLLNRGEQMQKAQFNSFCRDIRLLNFSKFSSMLQQPNQNDFISEMLRLYQGVFHYCEYVKQFLQRSTQIYQHYLLSKLWKQYEKNIEIFEQIYPFDLINENFSQYGHIPYQLTVRQFMYKIWGNSMKEQISLIEYGEQVLHLMESEDDCLKQSFNCFVAISFNEYQLEFCGMRGMMYSASFAGFLKSLKRTVFQYFDKAFQGDLQQIVNFSKVNQFNKVFPKEFVDQIIFPWIFEYAEQQIQMDIRGSFRETKKYLVETVLDSKKVNSTLYKIVSEEEKISFYTQNEMLYSQCNTTYGSIFHGKKKIEIQHQQDTVIYNHKGEWQLVNEIDQQCCTNLISFCDDLDKLKRSILEQQTQVTILGNKHDQKKALGYFNTILDYTHVNNSQDVQNILLPLWLHD